MSTPILRIVTPEREWWLVWSTVVDAPVTYGMTREELIAWWGEEYGKQGVRNLGPAIARAEEVGTSSHRSPSVEEMIICNRAGVDETRLTEAEIVAMYCLRTGLIRGMDWRDEADDGSPK